MKTREALRKLERTRFTDPKEDRDGLGCGVISAGVSAAAHLILFFTSDSKDVDARSYAIGMSLLTAGLFIWGALTIQKRKILKQAEITLADSYLLRTEGISDRPFALTCIHGHEQFVCWCYDFPDAMTACQIIRNAYSTKYENCIEGVQIYDFEGKECLDSNGYPLKSHL